MKQYDGAFMYRWGINPRRDDFFALSGAQVEAIAMQAKDQGYRKPKNANGSTARYFYARLQREMSK